MRASVTEHESGAGIAQGVVVVGVEERRGGDDLGRNLDDIRPLNRVAQGRTQRHPAAEADDADLPGGSVQQQREVREKPLRQHVAAVRGVHLAVDRERKRAGHAAHRNGAGRALRVVEQRARFEAGLEIEAPKVGGVLVGATREQGSVPRRQRQRDENRHQPGRGCKDGARAAGARGQDDRDAGPGHAHGRAQHRRPQAERRDEHEACGQRARDGAQRIDGIDERRITRRRRLLTGCRGHSQRERSPQRQGGGQEQRDDDGGLDAHHHAERRVGPRYELSNDKWEASGDGRHEQTT